MDKHFLEKSKHTRRRFLAIASAATLTVFAALSLASASHSQTAPAPAPSRVSIVFSGGHDTDPRDRGRPVILVASALGVPPDVFREAFTHVHPAPAGSGPTPDEARQNKAALLSALAPYGVTNERLDTVSNYYRYVRSEGQLWPTTPAEGYAIVKHEVVISYVITRRGSGYSSPPVVTVPGVPGLSALVKLSFSKEFQQNGAVASIVAGSN